MSHPIPSFNNKQQFKWLKYSIISPLILLIWTFRVYPLLHVKGIISNTDFWRMINIAKNFEPNNVYSYIDPFYPIGYPLLLRIGLELNGDVLVVGLFISCFSAIFCLCCIYQLTLLLAHNSHVASIAACLAIVYLTPFINAVTVEGNDLPALAFQVASILMLVECFTKNDCLYPPHKRGTLLFAGTFLGIAYLMRYTSLVLLPISLIALALFTKNKIYNLANYSIGFFLLAILQIIPSLMATGNPIYNGQAKNVWFGIYGGNDWTYTWFHISPQIQLSEVIAMNPPLFFFHWIHEFTVFFTNPSLSVGSTSSLWLILLTTTIYLINHSTKKWARFIVFFMVICILIATSIAWLAPRFILLVLLLLIVSTCSGLNSIYKSLSGVLHKNKLGCKEVVSFGVLIVCVIIYSSSAGRLLDYGSVKTNILNEQIVQTLRTDGLVDANQVISNIPFLQLNDINTRDRFRLLNRELPPNPTAPSLIQYMRTNNIEYLALTYSDGLGSIDNLRLLDESFNSQLMLLAKWYSEDNINIVIYKLS